MELTPESKSILDLLLTGETITDETGCLGPLDDTTRIVLRVLRDDYDRLDATHGEQQAKAFLKDYQDATKPRTVQTYSDALSETPEQTKATSEVEQAAAVQAIAKIPSPPRWRLHGLTCRSVYGVAPFGEELSFPFDGKATLIYGPNGSGKSSLLGAIAWVLTGLTITDETEPTETTSIHRTSNLPKRGTRICDWPTVCTLPEAGDVRSIPSVSEWVRQFLADN